MGFSASEKPTSNSSDWVLSLKPIYTGVIDGGEDFPTTKRHFDGSGGEFCDTPTTPTSQGSRIPAKLSCPPPPHKRKPARCSGGKNKLCNGKREFFAVPSDLEAVFIRRHNVGC